MLSTEDLQKERKNEATKRWKVDELMIKVGKEYYYLYRSIDIDGKLVDVMFSKERSIETTKAFLKQAVATSGVKPKEINSDKNNTYPKAIKKVLGKKTKHRTAKYLNNFMERATRNQLLTISEKLKEVRPTTVRFRFAPTNLMARSVASGRAA
jgi:putative transposase